MSGVKIIKGLPFPSKPHTGGNKRREYGLPFEDMEIGDSFELPENYPYPLSSAMRPPLGSTKKFIRRARRIWRIK